MGGVWGRGEGGGRGEGEGEGEWWVKGRCGRPLQGHLVY